MRRRSRAGLLGGWVLFCAAGASPAKAQVTAILTADNHYGLFHGTAGGEELTYLGRNEMGPFGEPGDYNWTLPETYEFDAPADHHLYVVAWDEDGAGPVMWIGQFNLPDGSRIVSDTVAWECLCAAGPSPRNGEVPFEVDVSADIASGAFGSPRWALPNGSEPWSLYEPEGLIPEVGEDALFIWIDDSQSEGACGDHYVIFRTVEPIGGSGPVARKFIRGDCDGDRAVNLTDPVYLLTFLFLGGPDLPCRDAGDSDDSGDLSLSDAIIPLSYLFLGGPPRSPATPRRRAGERWSGFWGGSAEIGDGRSPELHPQLFMGPSALRLNGPFYQLGDTPPLGVAVGDFAPDVGQGIIPELDVAVIHQDRSAVTVFGGNGTGVLPDRWSVQLTEPNSNALAIAAVPSPSGGCQGFLVATENTLEFVRCGGERGLFQAPLWTR